MTVIIKLPGRHFREVVTDIFKLSGRLFRAVVIVIFIVRSALWSCYNGHFHPSFGAAVAVVFKLSGRLS